MMTEHPFNKFYRNRGRCFSEETDQKDAWNKAVSTVIAHINKKAYCESSYTLSRIGFIVKDLKKLKVKYD